MRLRRTKDIWEYTIGAFDADIGRVHDFYFDDQQWTIRYLVVETGVILSGRNVLISPTALRERPWSPLRLWTNLTSEQVRNSPSIDLHKPVSRQHEIEHHDHYGWPYYWPGEVGRMATSGSPRQSATGEAPRRQNVVHEGCSPAQHTGGYRIPRLGHRRGNWPCRGFSF
jgi:hypothetical protein